MCVSNTSHKTKGEAGSACIDKYTGSQDGGVDSMEVSASSEFRSSKACVRDTHQERGNR